MPILTGGTWECCSAMRGCPKPMEASFWTCSATPSPIAGVAEERIYEDRASGRKDHRPGLEACLKALQPGNTFVVWKLDRLGREDARAYLDWLLGECAEDGVDTLIEPAALDLMAMRLSTPLQFAEHLNRAFEAGFRMGQKPITADIVAATLAPDFDDLEPRLTRQGYSVKVLAEQFHARAYRDPPLSQRSARRRPHPEARRPHACRGAGVVTYIAQSQQRESVAHNLSPVSLILSRSGFIVSDNVSQKWR